MNALLAATLLSLFLPFKVTTPIVQLRPFDFLTLLLFLLAISGSNLRLSKEMVLGLLLLVPFFLWHVVSAFLYDFSNGVRESLQVGLVLVFIATLVLSIERITPEKLVTYVLSGFCLITLWNIGWHIDSGFMTGWKRLNEPKAVFTFLPLLVACIISSKQLAKGSWNYWILWITTGLVIAMSGERKALLSLILTFALFSSDGKILRFVPYLIAIAIISLFLGELIGDEYLSRQFQALTNPLQSTTSVFAIAAGDVPTSFSNSQRLFALEQAMSLFSEHPIIGIGTNAYADIISAQYYFLPEFMLAGIHGEPLRVLTENGVIGIILYAGVIFIALLRITKAEKLESNRIKSNEKLLFTYLFFIPCIIYVMFESSGTHALVAFSLISLTPGVFKLHHNQVFREVVRA